MHRFDYYAPTTVAEAANLLHSKGEGGKVIAGGTDLVPQMKERGRHPRYIVSLNRIPELRGIEQRGSAGIRIGAAERAWNIRNHSAILDRYNILAQGASLIGSIQTQNLATIGGNIGNAIPSADGVPAFIAMGAQATIAGPGGATRTMAVEDISAGVGRLHLAPDEIIVDILVPAPAAHSGGAYLRHCPRKEMDIAIAGVGTHLTLDAGGQRVVDARICLSAVAPAVIRATAAERALIGGPLNEQTIASAARAAAEEDARPISDARGAIEFRRYLIRELTVRTINLAATEARGGTAAGPLH